MGKIRVKTFDDQEAEKKQARLKQKRADAKEAKKVEKQTDTTEPASDTPVVASEEVKTTAKPQKKDKFKSNKAPHSKNYESVAGTVDANKVYKLADALEILPKLQRAKFDETVELHINTTETGVSGSVSLPHGTGKQVRVAIATDVLIADIEKGMINFDILVAEPQMMPKLAKVARILGPRGLMPNPKNGTVTPKPEEVAKKYEGGQMNFKTEAKAPLLHVTVGKVSFGDKKLSENIKTFLGAVDHEKVKNVTLKSTMSPGIKLDTASL